MALINELLDSNAIQLILTVAFGAILYFCKIRLIIVVTAITLCVGIVLSFLLVVGEVSTYSSLYRRAFFIFGDDVTSVINFGFLYVFARRKIGLSLFLLLSIFLSGGKASIILLLIMVVAFILIQRRGSERKEDFLLFFKLSLLGVLMYAVLMAVSPKILEYPSVVSFRISFTQMIGAKVSFSDHRTSCSSLSQCYKTQIESSLQDRYYTSIGGLWMMLDGGYSGNYYPNSAEKFADLMIEANPWDINTHYGLDRNNWLRMGGVHNPYMSFGSGYGPWLLLAVIGGLAVIGYIALRNLAIGESDVAAVFSIYFIVTILLNQTQSWLMSASPILVLLGVCGSHIVLTWLARTSIGLPVICAVYLQNKKDQLS